MKRFWSASNLSQLAITAFWTLGEPVFPRPISQERTGVLSGQHRREARAICFFEFYLP